MLPKFPLLPINTHAPSVSMRRMRRYTTRCLRLVKKHAGKNRTLSAVAQTIVPVAERFADLYDHDPAVARSTKLQKGHEQVDILRQTVRNWLALVQRDLPIDPAKYPAGGVPDDVFAAAKMLISTLKDAQAQSPLVYADSALEELEALLAAAKAAWDEARAEVGAIQEHRQQRRRAAVALQAELVTFRRVLRTVLGRRHEDYQTLRATRGSGPDGEDEQIEGEEEVPAAETLLGEPAAEDSSPSDDSGPVDASGDVDAAVDASGDVDAA